MSAENGLKTFRDSNDLWEEYDVRVVTQNVDTTSFASARPSPEQYTQE
jgi:NAD-dependent SIR2 family protein deacetylase